MQSQAVLIRMYTEPFYLMWSDHILNSMCISTEHLYIKGRPRSQMGKQPQWCETQNASDMRNGSVYSILVLMAFLFKHFEKLTDEEEYNFSESLKQKMAKW